MVAMHLPTHSISTIVEDRALNMLLELLNLKLEEWKGRMFTTGTTGSNILGLACGKEVVIGKRLKEKGECRSVGEWGPVKAMRLAGVKDVQVLIAMGHSSVLNAASIAGLGRDCVKDVGRVNEPWSVDFDLLGEELKREMDGVLSILPLNAGEVKAGKFGTDMETLGKIRTLCSKYGAWLHVDGAFGLFGRSLPQTSEFALIHSFTSGIELADSITGDCHKLLNVPYECGFFLTKPLTSLSSSFQTNAVYRSTEELDIPHPMNIGLENSRRFRALPVYSVLMHGHEGLADMFPKQVRLARAIAKWLSESKKYELLLCDDRVGFKDVHVVVIFRVKDDSLNEELVKRINDKRKINVSGTVWEDRQAARIAVSTWMVDVEKDLKIVADTLSEIV